FEQAIRRVVESVHVVLEVVFEAGRPHEKTLDLSVGTWALFENPDNLVLVPPVNLHPQDDGQACFIVANENEPGMLGQLTKRAPQCVVLGMLWFFRPMIETLGPAVKQCSEHTINRRSLDPTR